MLDSLNSAIRWLATCVLLVGLLQSSPASAFVEVRQHKMQCSAAFPCPRELQDRVNFWIDIYSRWDSQDAVLHDSVVPSRVYKVIEGRACGRKGNTAFIKDQKKRIAAELHTLAKKGMALKAIAKALTRSEESTKARAKEDGLNIAKLR